MTSGVQPLSSLTRRDFLQTTSAGVVAATAAAVTFANASPPARPSRVVGIQICPSNLLDEGMERCLDFLQEHGRINALFCYSQTYHLGEGRLAVLARDHPVPPRNPAGRRLPHLWARLPAAAFRDLPLQHAPHDPELEFADRDIFHELTEPCRRRGIRVYARMLEAGMRRADRIPGYRRVATVTLDGKPGRGPCWNHPDYREWVRRTVEALLGEYPLDGLQYGAERAGPLSDVLIRGEVPECFCEHCRRRHRESGVDPERAQEGFRQLHQQIRSLTAGEGRPPDGVLATILRTFMRYSEILAWDRAWFESDSALQRLVYETAKRKRPEADVGQHVDHQRSSWDLFYRAAVSYADLATHNDFIKPILYHDILGPRLRGWVLGPAQARVLHDLSADQALTFFYALFGHSADREPGLEDLAHRGLSSDYVFRETSRCVQGVAGRARVYAGIGIDVPWHAPEGIRPFPSDPEGVFLATRKALEAGADGVIASREYEEIIRSGLAAFGRAIS